MPASSRRRKNGGGSKATLFVEHQSMPRFGSREADPVHQSFLHFLHWISVFCHHLWWPWRPYITIDLPNCLKRTVPLAGLSFPTHLSRNFLRFLVSDFCRIFLFFPLRYVAVRNSPLADGSGSCLYPGTPQPRFDGVAVWPQTLFISGSILATGFRC